MLGKLGLAFMLASGIGLLTFLLLPDRSTPEPPAPHQFFGSVTVGEELAQDDLVIEAKEAPTGGATFAKTATLDGKYGYLSLFLLPSDDPATTLVEGFEEGYTIYFFVDGIEVGTSIFQPGESTEMDLAVTQN